MGLSCPPIGVLSLSQELDACYLSEKSGTMLYPLDATSMQRTYPSYSVSYVCAALLACMAYHGCIVAEAGEHGGRWERSTYQYTTSHLGVQCTYPKPEVDRSGGSANETVQGILDAVGGLL